MPKFKEFPMTTHDLASLSHSIDTAFDNRDAITTATTGEVRDAVETALNLLDAGKVRVADRGEDGNWTVNQWLKKAVLLSFRLNPMEVVKGFHYGYDVESLPSLNNPRMSITLKLRFRVATGGTMRVAARF